MGGFKGGVVAVGGGGGGGDELGAVGVTRDRKGARAVGGQPRGPVWERENMTGGWKGRSVRMKKTV